MEKMEKFYWKSKNLSTIKYNNFLNFGRWKMKMNKETIGINITEDFKTEVFELIDNTIEKVLIASESKLTDAEKRKIKNLSLDQLNVNVTHKIGSKTLWVFSVESTLPVVVEMEPGLSKGNSLIKKNNSPIYFEMKKNFGWVASKEKNEKSLTKKQFEEKIFSMLKEDIETAVFYGTTSYIRK